MEVLGIFGIYYCIYDFIICDNYKTIYYIYIFEKNSGFLLKVFFNFSLI